MQRTLVIVLIVGCFTTPASATNGLNLISFGARSTGLAGAFTAVADDTTSINSNPAGLSHISRQQVDLSLDVSWASPEHTDQFGGESQSNLHLFAAPWFGYAYRIPDSPVTVGIGAYLQGGVANDLDDIQTAFGTLDDVFINLNHWRFAPAVAYRVGDRLSFGAALMVSYATLDFELFPDTSVPPNPLLPQGFFGQDFEDGTGWGVGGRVGFQYRVSSLLTLGAQYASPTYFDFEDGRLEVDFSGLGLGKVRYDARVDDFAWPQEVSVGAALRPTEGLLLAIDIKWINWDGALDTVVVRGRNPSVPVAPAIAVPVRLDWDDQLIFAFGAEYRFANSWSIRAGINHANNPVPDRTLTPLFTSITTDHVTFGAGYEFETFSLQFALIHAVSNRVKYTNPDFPFGVNAAEEVNGTGVEFMVQYRF